MISLYIVIGIFIFHWFADFVMQDERWALNKSKSIVSLLKHTSTYSILWIIPGLVIGWNIEDIFRFVSVTFILHTLTDFITSKQTSKLYTQGKFGSSIPNLGFFTVIGFDQVLHYTQLFLTYYLITTIK